MKLCDKCGLHSEKERCQSASVSESELSGLLCCPVCSEKLDLNELHLGIIFCRNCELHERSFDIDTGSEKTARELLRKMAT